MKVKHFLLFSDCIILYSYICIYIYTHTVLFSAHFIYVYTILCSICYMYIYVYTVLLHPITPSSAACTEPLLPSPSNFRSFICDPLVLLEMLLYTWGSYLLAHRQLKSGYTIEENDLGCCWRDNRMVKNGQAGTWWLPQNKLDRALFSNITPYTV